MTGLVTTLTLTVISMVKKIINARIELSLVNTILETIHPMERKACKNKSFFINIKIGVGSATTVLKTALRVQLAGVRDKRNFLIQFCASAVITPVRCFLLANM